MSVVSTTCSRPIDTLDDRKRILKENKLLGSYNDSLIIFMPTTREYWAVLVKKMIKLSLKEVRQMGIPTKACK